MKVTALALFLAPLALVPALALAQQAGESSYLNRAPSTGYVDLLAGLTYTDNALLTMSNKRNDEIAMVGLDSDYVHRGRLSLNLLGNVDRLEYLHHSFSGSFYGRFDGIGIWGLPTDPLQWQLHESFGEATLDPLAADTPQNLETINDVSTGPMLNLHFGLVDELTVFGVYSRATYQRSPYDAQTYEGGARFTHKISGASVLTFEASDARTDYLELAALLRSNLSFAIGNYNIRRADAAYKAEFSRTSIFLQGGYEEFGFVSGPMHGSALYSLEITRRISPYTAVFISGRSGYSTVGGSLTSPQARIGLESGGSLGPTYAVPQPYEERIGTLGWNFRRARTRLSLAGTIGQVRFNATGGNINLNYVEDGGVLTLGRQLRPTVAVQLRVQFNEERFRALGATRRWDAVVLSFSKHFARTMIAIYAERLDQNSSPGASAFLATSFHDDRVGFYVTYDLFGARPVEPSMRLMPGMRGLSTAY